MKNKIENLLKELVKINSINPAFKKGEGESEIAEWVDQWLKSIGISSEIQVVAPGRKNVVAVIPGQDRQRSILLNAHLDTVSVEGMDDPFILRKDGDRLYGLGAYDMKGSDAIMLALAEYFAAHKPPIDILLTFVCDEEEKSIGMDYIAEKWLPNLPRFPNAGIFLEPTEEEIGICHKGFAWYEIEVCGKAAHGSRPAQGIDAILPLYAALKTLSEINKELKMKPPHPLLGYGSLHGGLIKGGVGLSTIPAQSKLQWERRTLPGESEADLIAELERVIQAVNDVPGDHQAHGRKIFVREPHQVSDKTEIAERFKKASPTSKIVGLSFWADSAIGGAAGMPSIIYGPLGHGAHAIDEWVSLSSLVEVYNSLLRLIEGFA